MTVFVGLCSLAIEIFWVLEQPISWSIPLISQQHHNDLFPFFNSIDFGSQSGFSLTKYIFRKWHLL